MNWKRYLLSTIALFVFIFLYELFIHDFVLISMYKATANVWRDFSVMEERLSLAICFQVAISAWSAFVFSKLYKNGGIKNGLLFGFFFGVFGGILTASWYQWLNVPATLAVSWFISSLIEGLGGGLILGGIYRRF